jgi:hypothetical protein
VTKTITIVTGVTDVIELWKNSLKVPFFFLERSQPPSGPLFVGREPVLTTKSDEMTVDRNIRSGDTVGQKNCVIRVDFVRILMPLVPTDH